MRVGIVSYWFNRGQGTVGRWLRSALDELGHDTHVLARPTKAGFHRPEFVADDDVWALPRVTRGSAFNMPADEYGKWAEANQLEAVFFDQNYQFDAIRSLRETGVMTVGRFTWEAFRPEHIEPAARAFDVVYSVTRAEQRRYARMRMESPLVRWGCHPETLAEAQPHDGPVTFLFPGGYLSRRKPLAAVIEAFGRVGAEDVRLVVKTQGVQHGHPPAAELVGDDPRITVLEADLDAAAYRELLRSADVLLAPSRWEGLGLHLYEATGCGLPIVTNNRPPMAEVVRHERNGLLVASVRVAEPAPSGIPAFDPDVDVLTAAIERLRDPKLRARLARGARRRAQALDWSLTVADIGALLTPARRARSVLSPPSQILIQGMRRSGTTIFYDILRADPAWTSFYEPLAALKPSRGGGSGVRDEDLFDAVRSARDAFVESRADVADPDILNHGAPRAPELEFELDLPDVVRAWVRSLVEGPEPRLVKFTRMYRKVRPLAELAPLALFIHVVRDPRAVTCSYLFGRGGRRRGMYRDATAFFGAFTDHTAWSSLPFSERIRRIPGYEIPDPLSDVERILLNWRFTFEQTFTPARRLFRERHLLVRHEDLCADPQGVLQRIYARLDAEPPQEALEFAQTVVRPPHPPFAADDSRWQEAFATVGLGQALVDAGYPELGEPRVGESERRLSGLEQRVRAEMAELSRRGPGVRSRVPPHIRFLFVCGCPRSGTTALTTFLNEDERVLLGQERYRRVIEWLEPFHFSEPLFFNPTLSETSWARASRNERVLPGTFADYEALRDRWRSGSVEILGDKAPNYHRHLPQLLERFPAARVVMLLRDVEGVANSYERRAQNADDHWPRENDHRLAVEHWNEALASALHVLRSEDADRVLLVDYERFYSGAPEELERVYTFIGLMPPPDARSRHSALAARQRAPVALDDAAAQYVDAHADRALEAQVRELAF